MYDRPVAFAYDPKATKELVNETIEPGLKQFTPDWPMVIRIMNMDYIDGFTIASLWNLASDWEGQYIALSALDTLDVLRDRNEDAYDLLEHVGHEWDLLDRVSSDLMGLFFNLADAYLPDVMSIFMGSPIASNDYSISVYLDEEVALMETKFIAETEDPSTIYTAYDFRPLAWVVVDNETGDVMTTFEPDEAEEVTVTYCQVGKSTMTYQQVNNG